MDSPPKIMLANNHVVACNYIFTKTHGTPHPIVLTPQPTLDNDDAGLTGLGAAVIRFALFAFLALFGGFGFGFGLFGCRCKRKSFIISVQTHVFVFLFPPSLAGR